MAYGGHQVVTLKFVWSAIIEHMSTGFTGNGLIVTATSYKTCWFLSHNRKFVNYF